MFIEHDRCQELSHTWRHSMIVARHSTGSLPFGTAFSLRPGPVTVGIFHCRNFTVAATKISPCSRILSASHLSKFRSSHLLARMARSITKGKGWPLNIIKSALRSWATSRILESPECSLSHSWLAFRYQSAMLSIRMGLIWMLGQVHTGVMMGRQEDLIRGG